MDSTPVPNDLSRQLEQWFQVEKALLVGRAATGLLVALQVWRAGRAVCRVAIPGAICHEVLLAILAAGAQPIFCDVDVETGLVPDSEWARARTAGAEVAIVVHLYGNPSRMDRVRAIFPAPQYLVIDDAAQALGSRSEDGLCGALGTVGLLSFGHTKQISIGNGAVLANDAGLAARIRARLPMNPARDHESKNELQKAFRSRLQSARDRLTAGEVPDVSGFAGLLDGADWMLDVPVDNSLANSIGIAVHDYSRVARERIDKAALWRSNLQGTPLVPVGMGDGCVPWRFVCRFPGINWRTQSQLAEAIRTHNIHVSNWYFPANWFLGGRIGSLPGVEALSREVFQFWLDETTSHESIVESASLIRRELADVSLGGAHL